jgi:adenine-specific DNA methylase
VSLESHFDPVFAAKLALREKQIQQNYRPIIGVHKWFARRPGTLFRNLLLAEFNGSEPAESAYWRAHQLRGVIADPFMGGGTPLIEANRLGFNVMGADVNPMAYWIVRQSLDTLDIRAFLAAAEDVAAEVDSHIAALYQTECTHCRKVAPVKYFLWVKQETCPHCGVSVDLFPGYLLAEAVRHPKHVVACQECGALNECEAPPTREKPSPCRHCQGPVMVDGTVRRQTASCRHCSKTFRLGNGKVRTTPPVHRMWAMEYHCSECDADHKGRFFKTPEPRDLQLYFAACERLRRETNLAIPPDKIPPGDETDRLHRWGYTHYREMFNDRQLLGLGLLLKTIRKLANVEVRNALLTVFSDFLRYQNMLCRYDTYALKCQDIFSVHGFPVGLIQCENNVLGIPRVGSGSFRHFVEKYKRAKQYCEQPFETQPGKRKKVVPVVGERIAARMVDALSSAEERQACLSAGPAAQVQLQPQSLDGVFTDPPYYANVQYAELMDFCYVWLRLALGDECPAFERPSTRSPSELTGNETMGRDLEHFTEGLSEVFARYGDALKPGAPFVFTYHHNDPAAYVPVVVAILDAALDCSATLPAVAEMSASLHILGTDSSVLDTVFVCRRETIERQGSDLEHLLREDATAMRSASVPLSRGDLRCLLAGHTARVAVNRLREGWDSLLPLSDKMERAKAILLGLRADFSPDILVPRVLQSIEAQNEAETQTFAAAV